MYEVAIMSKITVDDKDFQNKLQDFLQTALNKKDQAIRNVASEVLRISQFKVPHNKGTLQNSGFVEDGHEEAIVGYNTVYAARLHEHPEYRFKNGRQGKYLENAIKENLQALQDYIKSVLGG